MKSGPQSPVIDHIGIVLDSLEQAAAGYEVHNPERALSLITDSVNIELIDTAERRGRTDQT